MSTPIIAEETAQSTDERTQVQQSYEAAWATDCGIPGCSGTGHDPHANPVDWGHEVVSETFDGGIVSASIWVYSDGTRTTAHLDYAGAGDCTAEELRDTADLYEAFPAFLRSIADRLEVAGALPADNARMTERRLKNAKYVRDALTFAGKGAEDLMNILGSTPGHALALWSGRAWYDVQQLENIANALNLPVADFVTAVVS